MIMAKMVTKRNKNMKCLRLLLLLLSMVFSPCMFAQMKVVSFRLLENDLTATIQSRVDRNGQRAALIKIVSPVKGLTFSGGALGFAGDPIQHDGETWLYVPQGAQRLTISHTDFTPLRGWAYPMVLEGGRTYEMLIDIGVGRFATITTQVAQSDVYVDGEFAGKSPVFNKYLSFAKHTIKAVKDRFEGEREIYVSNNDSTRNLHFNIEMKDMSTHYGDVTVSVANNADLWFAGRYVGTGTWKEQLREGNYTIEARKVDCDPVTTSFVVKAQQQNQVTATPPTPYTGQLAVYTQPADATVTYNGNHPISLSEPVTLPIGTYQMQFARKGYVSFSQEYTVQRNTMTTDTVRLDRISFVKPKGFYFGVAYTLSKLSGFTGLLGGVWNNHDLQLSYTFGISETSTIYTAGSGQQSGMKFKQNSIGVRYGYQIPLLSRFALIPQVGFSYDTLSGTLVEGSTKFGDNANSSSLTLGFKVLAVPMQHFYFFVAPEYDIAISKSNSFEAIANEADFSAGGFVMNVGLLVNF